MPQYVFLLAKSRNQGLRVLPGMHEIIELIEKLTHHKNAVGFDVNISEDTHHVAGLTLQGQPPADF